jgi:ribA/ribD-fused uncharacterized protein
VISEFSRNYSWLSNFYPTVFAIGDDVFVSVEHAYQAAKVTCREEWFEITQASTPAKAKRLGRKAASIRHDWDEVKVGVMRTAVAAKFQNPELAEKLIATGDALLIEGNEWGDRFWGVYKGRGHNMLGKILMEVRANLIEAAKYAETNQTSTSDATTIPQSNQA